MNEELIVRVSAATSGSELVAAVASTKGDGGLAFALGGSPLRSLADSEIDQLERAGNSCGNWSRVRVADSFDSRRVRNCQFLGDIVLGRFTRRHRIAENVELLAGIESGTLANCVIGNEALIRDVKLLANYVVGEGAILFDCGTIVCEGHTSFGNGDSLSLGNESGGREVPVFADIDIEMAGAVAQYRRRKVFLRTFRQAVAEYRDKVISNRGIISREVMIRSTPNVRNTYFGPNARIDGATLVADSTLLSSKEEPVEIGSGACVTGSLLQWGSGVSTLAVVDRSVLTEHSHVEQHGRVSASILGPNCGVARGEVSSSLVGPFVNLHHESLLIASLWPEGRGNVSYGVMAGANHTSKAPDQEFRLGEGTFLGLGVKVRFPADLSRAPYTVFAAGVTALPQKILFPFSLINVPSEHHAGVPPAYNEIFPAWLLTDNFYALRRNEGKFQTRNRARRARFDFRVLRPNIVDLMRDACRRLEAVQDIKKVYSERDISGLGKNYLTELSRGRAILGYRFYIRFYALRTLKEKVERFLDSGHYTSLEKLLREPSTETEWEQARQIISEEPDIHTVDAGLRLLPVMLEEVAQSVERSKAKDDERGVRIMDDYADTHIPAAQDPIVRQTWSETRRLSREIDEILLRLDFGATTSAS
jgi:hypothetical protein